MLKSSSFVGIIHNFLTDNDIVRTMWSPLCNTFCLI